MVATDPAPSSGSDVPRWARQLLEHAGIDVDSDVLTIRQRLQTLGLEVLELGEEWSGVPHGTPRYLAAVSSATDVEGPIGLQWSRRGYSEALARAAAVVLRERDG